MCYTNVKAFYKSYEIILRINLNKVYGYVDMPSKTVLGPTLKAFTVKSRPHFVCAIVSIVVALAHDTCRAQQ